MDKLYHTKVGAVVEDFGRLLERWVRTEPDDARYSIAALEDFRLSLKNNVGTSEIANVHSRIGLMIPPWIDERMTKLHPNYLDSKEIYQELMKRFPIFRVGKVI